MIGDVRGTGLFVGIELVECKETRKPAPASAKFVVDRMKSNHRILVSADGPNENVIKLKPPMIFTIENADEFLCGFKECLNTLQPATQEVLYK